MGLLAKAADRDSRARMSYLALYGSVLEAFRLAAARERYLRRSLRSAPEDDGTAWGWCRWPDLDERKSGDEVRAETLTLAAAEVVPCADDFAILPVRDRLREGGYWPRPQV
jgi:hypothetical protein